MRQLGQSQRLFARTACGECDKRATKRPINHCSDGLLVTGLQPATNYTAGLYTVHQGVRSQPATMQFRTRLSLLT